MKVFLSHSSEDKPLIEDIANQLSDNGIEFWLDKSEIKYGDSLIKKISESIHEVTHVLAFLSKQSVQSDWVKFELELASTGEINSKKLNVIPVLIEPCEIPPYLRHKLYCDLSTLETRGANLSELISQLKGKSDTFTGNVKIYDKPHSYKLNNYTTGIILSCLVILFLLRKYIPNANEAFNLVVIWLVVQLSSYFVDGGKAVILKEAQKTIPNFARSISNFQIYGILRPAYLNEILKYSGFTIIKVYLFFAITSSIILFMHFVIAWQIINKLWI